VLHSTRPAMRPRMQWAYVQQHSPFRPRNTKNPREGRRGLRNIRRARRSGDDATARHARRLGRAGDLHFQRPSPRAPPRNPRALESRPPRHAARRCLRASPEANQVQAGNLAPLLNFFIPFLRDWCVASCLDEP
jgi:hypothetical protein